MKRLSGVVASSVLVLGCVASVHAQEKPPVHFTDATGREVTLHYGQPAPESYGPKPSFAQLDTDHDGTISRAEAEAYVPLANDFDYLAQGKERITPREYAHWDQR